MKKLFSIIALTATTSILCADQYGQFKCPSESPSGQSYQDRSGSQNQNEDQRIIQELQNVLPKYEDISFSVIKGKVILFGSVQSNEDRNDLEQDVRKIQGVQNVDLQEVRVQGQTGSGSQSRNKQSGSTGYQYQNGNSSDKGYQYQNGNGSGSDYQYQKSNSSRQTQTKKNNQRQQSYQNDDQGLADEVQNQLGQRYNNVQVSVRNGVVTLRGSVTSREDKKNLENQVRQIQGVRDVKNSVTIQSKNSY